MDICASKRGGARRRNVEGRGGERGREVYQGFDGVAPVTQHSPANPSNRPRLRPDSWRRARLGPSGAPPAPRPLAANVEGELKGEKEAAAPRPSGATRVHSPGYGHFRRIFRQNISLSVRPGAQVRAPGRGQPRVSASPRPRRENVNQGAPQILVYTHPCRPKSWCIRAPPAMYTPNSLGSRPLGPNA